MSIQGAIYNILSGTAAVTALVGTRIYPVVAPDGAEYPLIVYTVFSNERILASGGSTDLNNPSIQISCWGDSYASARNVAIQAIAAIEDYAGTQDSTVIQHIFYGTEQEFFEPTTKKYHIPIDFEAWHT